MKKIEEVVIILGPTAAGKSDVAVNLAKQIDAEIISADSTQVYRGFDIGSGKVTKEEMQGIPHHLLDILNFDEEFNVALFKQLAEEKIAHIKEKGKNVIICGGTGLYIKALTEGYNFFDVQKNESLRQELEEIEKEKGVESLFEILKQKDKKQQFVNSIDCKNKVRLIRAIEILQGGGKQISNPAKFKFKIFIINLDREVLYKKINKRVDQMVETGLFEEVQNLINQGANLTHSSFKSIGYKEVYEHLAQQKTTKQQAIENIKQNSRKYAKRQLTWLRKVENATWLDNTNKLETAKTIKSILG